jgi:hypothetical protein
MTWQWLAVGVIVMAALAYLTRRTWRTWVKRGRGCGGGCGCAAKPTNGMTIIPANELQIRKPQG